MKDKYGKELHVGDTVAASPNSGWYGKWRIATVAKIDPDKAVRIKYNEICLSPAGDWSPEPGRFEHTYSYGFKDCRDLILLDTKTLQPVK